MIDVPILVKDALRDGTLKKNYRFNVLNDDGTTDFTIDNNTLVKESVSIDERMCSGDSIKFGLCEGSSLEFQYFNHPNITNRRIQAFIDVQYEDESHEIQWHEIPMGFFEVKESSRQASTGIIKVVAYNKLQSEYLDKKANALIKQIAENGEQGFAEGVTYYYLLNKLLSGYAIDNRADDVIQSHVFGESKTRITVNGSSSGNVETAQEIAAFAIYKQKRTDTTIKKLEAIIYIQRKLIFTGTRTAEYAHSKNSGEYFPIGYNRATFSNTISKELRNGFNVTFGEYTDDNEWEYYIVPVSASISPDSEHWDTIHIPSYFQKFGTAKKLKEILDSDYNLWADGTFNGSENTAIANTFVDSAFKGLVAIDNDTRGTQDYSNYPNMRIMRYTDAQSIGTGYKNYQYITPKNRDCLDYYWINTNASSDTVSCNCAVLILPSLVYKKTKPISGYGQWDINYIYPWDDDGVYDYKLEMRHKNISTMENQIMLPSDAENLADVTIRDFQSAVYESGCQFGQLDRKTDLFSGHELNGARLLPQETLYPDNSLYPYGGNLSAFKSMYSKLWADEGNIQSWRYLIITYKGLDEGGNEKEYKLQRTVNEHGTQNYNCSDNWLFRNLVWTSEQIGQYADAMVEKMRDMRWFPFEMWCAGLPYVETGDEIEIAVGEETYTTYVLQRQLKGIQNLQDTYINGTLDIF